MEQSQGILKTMRGLDPVHFEQLLADIWQERQGWATKVTQASRDWGVDVVGQPPGGGPKTALQAKRYDGGNKVSSEEVQRCQALREQHPDVEGVTIVTTSSFTKPAQRIAERLDVKCIDGQQLVKIVRRSDATEIVEWYDAGKPRDWDR